MSEIQKQNAPYAVASLVLGICSLVFGCFFVGLVCGIVGLVLAKKGLTIQCQPRAVWRLWDVERR